VPLGKPPPVENFVKPLNDPLFPQAAHLEREINPAILAVYHPKVDIINIGVEK
jgi:hypothetical protein